MWRATKKQHYALTCPNANTIVPVQALDSGWHSTICFLFGLGLLLISGCTFDRVNNIHPNQSVTLSPGTGMVVGSVTAPKNLHYWEVSYFRFRNPDESIVGVFESASPTTNFLWMKSKPIQPGGTGPDAGLEQQLGRLFARTLPVGVYEIYQLDKNDKHLFKMQPVRFEVRSQEILYLGNLHVHYCLYSPNRKNYRGYINGGIPTVRDETQRDLPLLAGKFPVLKGMKIRSEIINDDGWKKLGKTGLPSPETAC